jgi:hypothetical protein
MTNNLNGESSLTANGLQPLTEITQSGHSGTTQGSLIGLDLVIQELKRMKANYKALGRLMEAKAIAKAVDNLRGMA